MNSITHICLVGLGEVGSALADGLSRLPGMKLTAWDWKFTDPASPASRNAAARPNVALAAEAATAAEGCDLVISAVTAAQALPAAQSIMPSLAAGAWYLDFNSVSPAVKRQVEQAVEGAEGRFVEAVVMSPIAPRHMASPMLVGGPHAADFLPHAKALGFSAMSLSGARTGQAAASKMCRSVVVKGMEALLTEALLAARYHSVEQEVLSSLGDMFPGPDWQRQAHYMISRSLQHGVRRAEEMREAAQTVTEAGIEPLMSEACAQRQDWAAQFDAALDQPELPALLDSILNLNQSTIAQKPKEQVGL